MAQFHHVLAFLLKPCFLIYLDSGVGLGNLCRDSTADLVRQHFFDSMDSSGTRKKDESTESGTTSFSVELQTLLVSMVAFVSFNVQINS